MSRLLRVALGFYVVSISLGLVLRFHVLHPLVGLNFSHALHAHSHTLYFGWAGLAVCALVFRLTGRTGRSERAALYALAAVAGASFVSFLQGGYSSVSIVVSSVALLVLGWLVVLLWRAADARFGIAGHYLRVASVYLALAVAGALGRAVLMALHVADPLWAGLAIFAFIHNFAWFLLLAVIALLRLLAPRLGLELDDRGLSRQLALFGAFAWATFPLGVVAAHATVFGTIARLASLALVAPVALWAVKLWRAPQTARPGTRVVVRWLALWSAAHAAMELFGALGFAELATSLRHPAIAYLHVMLVGTVTTTLLTVIAVELGRPFASPLLHQGGLAVMASGLLLASAPGLLLSAPGWTVIAGLCVAAAGALMLVTAGIAFAVRLVVRDRRELKPPPGGSDLAHGDGVHASTSSA